MKAILTSIFIFSISLNLFTQEADLLSRRNQSYQEYQLLKDTMSSRTWINMVNLSKKLEEVVILDGFLLDSLLTGTPNILNLETRIMDLAKVRDQLLTENARLNDQFDAIEKARKTFKLLFIGSGILVVFFIIATILLFNKFQRLNTQSDNYNNDRLKLKYNHKEEIDKLKNEIEKYAEEKLLLENSAIEIKKSFDILKSEKQLLAEEVSSTSDKEIEEIRKEMKEMSTEVAKILEEKDEFEEALGMANLKLAHQIDTNKKFEEELENLFNRFKGKEG